MSIIDAKNLIKTYTRFEKEEGLRGSIKSLFKREKITKTAVNSFNLEIKIVIAFTVFTLAFWRLGLKCYKSASS